MAAKVRSQREDDRVFSEMMQALHLELADQEIRIESLTDTILAIDNIGWIPLNGDYTQEKGVPLSALKKWAELNEQLLAINPLIKRGSNIRVSYIFGEDIEWQKDTPACKKFRELNMDLIFSTDALKEQEAALNTTGNLFYLLDKATKKVTRIPLHEITNLAVQPDAKEIKLFFERTWTETVHENLTSADMQARTKTVKRWYPVPDIDPRWMRSSLGGVPVESAQAILHVTVNKQIGWSYGVPDIQPAVFWAKAYKEFLEANYTLVRALAKFTFKITAATPAGAKRAAAKMAAATPVDPYTGQRFGAGGTATLTAGEDLQAVNKAGANVNFDAGKPLAAMVASALEVNVEHLLSTADAPGGSETLDTPQLKAMIGRQRIFARAFQKMLTYFGMKNVVPMFPPIQWEPVHRVIQAITTGASTNGLFPEEIRDMLVTVFRQYGIDPMPGLPEDGRNAKFVSGIDAAEQAQQQADLAQQGIDNQAQANKDKVKIANKNAGTSPQKTPKGSSGAKGRGPAGKLADGDHSQRKSQ